ncbi:MAG: sulfur transferase domain-containing protein [Hyphomicrobiales bacterium]|nr:sulfur transferase domain-containing protein [Hyphomicrobiales bacterium]
MLKTVLRFAKPYKRALSGGYRGLRRSVHEASPGWARRRLGRAWDYFDLIFVDHHIFRFIYANEHKVAPLVWRASQPAPYQIRRFKRLGVRTVLNLRGERNCGSYRLEARACRANGLKLVDFPMRSRGVPDEQSLRELDVLLREIEYPVVIHCKSGSDRAGLMSALYLIMKENRPPEEALRQLSLRYGHFKQADTGILDHFLEQYIEHNRRSPTPFMEWVNTAYDRKSVRDSFRPKGWANALVNAVLRRE